MTVDQLLTKYGIRLESTAPGRYYTQCPQCSHERRKANAKPLGVTIEADGSVHWGCNHCSWTGPENGRDGEGFAATYDYTDADGALLFQKVRNPPGREPRFWLRRPDGKGGWINGTKGVNTGILYHTPDVARAITEGRVVAVVEGEKDANSVRALGIIATCNAHGASELGKRPKWTRAHSEQLRGADIVVLNDNDGAGYAHADAICSLSHLVAKRVRRLDLAKHWPEIPKGGDVSDWLAAGHTGKVLAALIEQAPEYAPPAPEPEPEPACDSEVEITRLAKLSAVEYDQQREDAAEKLGIRFSILDKLVHAERGRQGLAGGDDKDPKQADVLIALSERAQELFHAPDATAYATIPIDDHLETWPVRSKGFRKWLAREYFSKTESAPNSDAIQSALNVIEARAHFDGAEREVYIRVGACGDRLYLDLADKRWRVVEISADGWRVIDRAPIPFRRPAGMRSLPDPVSGGSIDDLRPFLNISKDNNDSFVLAVSFTLAALRPRGPYPALALAGEHGSAKSTFTAVLRRSIDPNSAPLRALPREDRDLFIAANNGHLLAFDNVSKLPDWISDTLCRLATGGGFATRQLYSDQDEALFDAMRPVILNGIEDVIVRPDLADRSIFLNLQNIADDKRKAEKEFWREFDAAHPRILGALLEAMAHGLRQLPTTTLARTPRMADFALWGTACETAYWEAGTFMCAYGQNRDDAVSAVIEADNVATAVLKFMAERSDVTQTAADLLGALKMAVGGEKVEQMEKRKEWPSSPRALSGRVRRAAGTLRKVGIEVTFGREPGTGIRFITIANHKPPQFASQPSRPSQFKDVNGLDRDANCDANYGAAVCVTPTVTANPLKSQACDGRDDRDAKFPSEQGHGNGLAPGLSQRTIAELAEDYTEISYRLNKEGAEIDSAALDANLRHRLAEMVLPEFVEVEFERVMAEVFRV
jgi:hypothetical protein